MIISEQKAIILLNKGYVIGVPTDTVYGFCSLEENTIKIYNMKKRSLNKPLIKMINNRKMIGKYDEKLNRYFSCYWPGQYTCIIEQNGQLNSYRIPNEPNLLSLIKVINKPLLTTSANITREEPCLSAQEFQERFKTIPLLEEKIKSSKSKKASKIYICINNKKKQERKVI